MRTKKSNISFKSKALKWGRNTQKVYKWIFKIVIAKNVSITCIFNQHNSFNNLIHSSLSCIFKCLIKTPLWRKINNTTFYFLIFLVKPWSKNRISIPIHPRIINYWRWLFGGDAFQGWREAEAGREALMMRCGETCNTWQ